MARPVASAKVLEELLPPLLPAVPVWTDGDAVGLRDWLVTPQAQRALRQLVFLTPRVSCRDNPELRRIQSDERAGYEACIQTLLALAEPGARQS